LSLEKGAKSFADQYIRWKKGDYKHHVRLSYLAESAAIQQCFSLTANQRTILSATINQRNEHAERIQMEGHPGNI
jgi:hypothetical protein